MSLIIRQPVRKVFHMGQGKSVYITLPPELGLKGGDEVVFEVEDDKIVMRKITR